MPGGGFANLQRVLESQLVQLRLGGPRLLERRVVDLGDVHVEELARQGGAHFVNQVGDEGHRLRFADVHRAAILDHELPVRRLGADVIEVAEGLHEGMHVHVVTRAAVEQLAGLGASQSLRRRDVRVALPLEHMLDVRLIHVHLGFGGNLGEALQGFQRRHLAAADVVLEAALAQRRPIANDHPWQPGAAVGHLGQRARRVVKALLGRRAGGDA